MNVGTLEQVLNAASALPGLAYITEMNISMEGSGQFAAMMQQLGTMKMTNKTVSVSVDPIADDLFTVPADYTIVKVRCQGAKRAKVPECQGALRPPAASGAALRPTVAHASATAPASTLRVAKQARGGRHGQLREAPEARVVAQCRVAQRLVPDTSGTLPRKPAQAHGDKIERAVGNARVDVHAAVVAVGLDVVASCAPAAGHGRGPGRRTRCRAPSST